MSRIIAIASGKGGVGKTWLGITLAHALAGTGRRILLFDGDLGLANVDVQLGLQPTADLSAVIAGRLRLERVIQHHAPSGFDVIPGRSGSGRLAGLDDRRLDTLLQQLHQLAGRYNLVLLDLPAGVDRGVRRLLACADRALIVTTDEPTALTDAYALIKVMREDGNAISTEVVVNLAASLEAGRAIHAGLAEVCRRFLGAVPGLAGVIRRDPRVAEAIRVQSPLLLRHPSCPAARDVESLARRLEGG